MLSPTYPRIENQSVAQRWLPANLESLCYRFEKRHPRETLRWALASFGKDVALASGFGPSGIVLMHLVSQLRPNTTVFYLQTDLLFPETEALLERLSERLGLQFTEVHSGLSLEEQAQNYAPELWRSNPDLCCYLRKVVPLRRFLANKRAWITGIRRDQSPTRNGVKVIDWDHGNNLIKICPLAAWSRDRVWDYLREHELPYNPLHDQGYASIGCIPCTQPVSPGEHERAGRWPRTGKLECGIHIQPVRNAPVEHS